MAGKARVVLCIISAFSCLLMGLSTLKAQAVGEITGRVTDPSGAVVPNARITATRVDTGVSQSTISTSAGTYTIPRLPVGAYTVTAEAGGFKTGVASGVTLDVSQQRQVDFTLIVGEVKSTVEVSAAPPLLDTTNGTLAGIVSEEQVQNLPLNGRDIGGLVMLQPGMVQASSTGWESDGWVGNGNRAESAVGSLDGADTTDTEFGSVQFTNFNLDAIAEFKVLQNDYTAQYGQGAGTITQIVTKSGTNQFHGSLFEFVRNSAFDARNFFATSVSPFRRNEFGSTFGGPVKKNNTFFFVQYAGLRQRLSGPNIVMVPTAAERNGAVTIPGPTGQPETLKKLLSFANSFGGFLVIGAKADSADGRIESLPGVDEQPGYKQKVVHWCFDAVSPPLLVEVSDAIPSPGRNGKFCYVIHTAESEVAPHFLNGRKGVWVRTDEFSQRFEPQLATESELRFLLNRRQVTQERRGEIVRRSRQRFQQFVSPEAQGHGDAKRSEPAVRLEVSIGPRFPARPICTQTALVDAFNNCRISWRGVGFPRVNAPLVSQHESILSLEANHDKTMVEANVWGMLFYGASLPTEIKPTQETITGIHLHGFAGHLLVFVEHAKQMMSRLGCERALSIDVTLSGILGIPWLYTQDQTGIYQGPKSPLDDEFSFSLWTTSEELKERSDALVVSMLQFVLFATNWSDYANKPASLDSLVRSGYKYNEWIEPPALRV